MLRKLTGIVLMVLLTVLLLCGCGSTATEKHVVDGKLYHVVTDATGREVEVPVVPKRIVSLTLGTDELLMDLVPADRIAALTYLSDDPGISHIADRSAAVPVKVRGTSAEQIIRLHPDLVLIPDWWRLETLDTLRQAGLSVYVYKTPYTVADVKKTITEVAALVGEETRGHEMLREFDSKIGDIQKHVYRHRELPERSALAITGKGAYGAKGSLYDDMCSYAHIVNCLKHLELDDNATISKEIVIQQDPDVIILPTWDAPGMLKVEKRDSILKDPSLSTVSAVRSGSVRTVPGKCLYCVSQYTADEIRNLAEAVYPEAFR